VNLGQKEEREMRKKQRGIGDVLFPVVKMDDLIDTFETHIDTSDVLLKAIQDMAEIGHEHAEEKGDVENSDRFNAIIGFLKMYRAGNSALIEKLYQAKNGKAA